MDWKSHYHRLQAGLPDWSHKPVIGITGNFGEKGCELAEGYYESVLRAGGVPLVIPPTEDTSTMVALLERIDGLILSGGGDMNPLWIDEEPVPALGGITPQRDLMELMLVRLAYDRQIPMLGICRGIQMLATALDGSVWQDLPSQYQPEPADHDVEPQPCCPLIKHSQQQDRRYASHTVSVEAGSLLHLIYNKGVQADEASSPLTLSVNSFHHQAVRHPGPHLRVSARAKDGVIEAVESTEYKSIVGVQWHPECFCLRGDDSHMPLFEWIVSEAANFGAARRFHERTLTLDSHCDTPMFFDEDIHFEQRDPRILVDLHKMTEGHLDATIMVAYLPQGELTSQGRHAAKAKADGLLNRIGGMITDINRQKQWRDGVSPLGFARTPEDLYRLKQEGRKAIMVGIENGYAIGDDLSLVQHFAERGIVYMTLCHNGNNDICGSARPRDGESLMGVTDFGASVIGELNRLGVMVDLSHASERSFYDALDISTQPIVCSHSSARALCDHPRNLTDDQLRALAAKGGVAQVTFYNGFLRRDGEATIRDAVAHLKHMVEVAGIQHVGIGTDFDGDGGVPGLASAAELINFTRCLLREQFSAQDLSLIWGGNFLRVMRQVQAASSSRNNIS